jgi:ribosome maturation factor RimP
MPDRKRARARFLCVRGEVQRTMSSPIQEEIEARLAATEPEVEVLTAELAGETVRLFIDHPQGVSLGLCERVTHHLAEVREQYALEVSSPGPKRPLTKPHHFHRFLGRRARVRTRGDHDGRQSFTGELVGASDDAVTIAADTGVIAIPYADITRSNLVEE